MIEVYQSMPSWPPTPSLEPPVLLPDVRTDDFDSGSPEKLLQWTIERSPRLDANPAATLNPLEETSWYRSQLEGLGDNAAYLNAIDAIIDNDPTLRDISPRTRALVCIPVAATTEYDSIFGTLSLYAQQDPEVTDDVTILIHANWTESAANSSEKVTHITQTLSEIERAKQAFPHLHIASFTSQFENQFVAERGGIVGEAVRRLYDVGLMTVGQMKQNGQNPDQDVLIIRNDGDAVGMDRHYLKQLLGAAERNPHIDAFTGVVRWETQTHTDYPGFGVVTNFREIMHATTALRNIDVPVMTVGINSAVRASTLAAIGGLGRGKYTGVGSDDREMGMRILDARNPYRVEPVAKLAVSRVVQEPIAYVPGAGIDSAADRLLTAYRRNLSITRAWDDFDVGGHTDRRATSTGSQLISAENIHDIEPIAARIEDSINGMINVWFRSPEHVRMGLSLTFPNTVDGAKVFCLEKVSGTYTFNFTNQGRKWLRERLIGSYLETPEPYGKRILRRLYADSASRPSRYIRANQA